MRALVDELASLPAEARLPRDAWPDIRSRIAGSSDPTVVPLESVSTGSARRFSFSLSQLVAAGVALAFVSGTSVWLAVNAGSPPVETDVAQVPSAPWAAAPVSDWSSLPASTGQDYQRAVAQLEAVLEEGRPVLGHRTIETIEESLATIDAAIDEALEALADDPGSDVLNRIVARGMWKKIQILTRTAGAIRARTT